MYVSYSMYDKIKRRSIGSASQIPVVPVDTYGLDSHVDTICDGSNCKIESTTGLRVRVKTFSDDLRSV